MSRNEKRNKFSTDKKSNSGTFVIIGIVVVALLGVGGFMFAKKNSSSDAGQVNVGSANYVGNKPVEFNKVQTAEAAGNITIDLNEIKNKKTVTFDVQGVNSALNSGQTFNYVPLLAYVSPKGNIVIATSLCEPCSGTTFHVEGDQLVCNSCGTRWTLDGLQGVSGGCTTYPPETIKYTVEGDKLLIKKADVQNRKPRVVS